MTHLPPHERRHFTRVGFSCGVLVEVADASTQAELVDISLKGVLLRAPTLAVAPGQACKVIIQLAEEQQIVMPVQLAHAHEGYWGFECTQLDMDSLTHLRRLIELNMDDPKAAERVLAELIKRNP